MPMSTAQLAALVDRAKQKAPYVVSPPTPAARPQRPVRPVQAASGPTAPAESMSAASKDHAGLRLKAVLLSPLPSLAPQPEPLTESDDFPVGWESRGLSRARQAGSCGSTDREDRLQAGVQRDVSDLPLWQRRTQQSRLRVFALRRPEQ